MLKHLVFELQTLYACIGSGGAVAPVLTRVLACWMKLLGRVVWNVVAVVLHWVRTFGTNVVIVVCIPWAIGDSVVSIV